MVYIPNTNIRNKSHSWTGPQLHQSIMELTHKSQTGQCNQVLGWITIRDYQNATFRCKYFSLAQGLLHRSFQITTLFNQNRENADSLLTLQPLYFAQVQDAMLEAIQVTGRFCPQACSVSNSGRGIKYPFISNRVNRRTRFLSKTKLKMILNTTRQNIQHCRRRSIVSHRPQWLLASISHRQNKNIKVLLSHPKALLNRQ